MSLSRQKEPDPSEERTMDNTESVSIADINDAGTPTDVEEMDEEARLNLFATAKDQDELERDIGRQADILLTEQADERDNKRLDKTVERISKLRTQLDKLAQRQDRQVANERAKIVEDIRSLENDLVQIKA